MADRSNLLAVGAVGLAGLAVLRAGGDQPVGPDLSGLQEQLAALREQLQEQGSLAQQNQAALNAWRESPAWEDFTEAFQADASSPGGLLSPIEESPLGGGNPNLGGGGGSSFEPDEPDQGGGFDFGGTNPFGGSSGPNRRIGGSTSGTGL